MSSPRLFTVNSRIYLTSAATAFAVAAGAAYDIFSDYRLLDEAHLADIEEQQRLLARVIELDRLPRSTWLYDYAAWDEMVVFVREGCTDAAFVNAELVGNYKRPGFAGVYVASRDGAACFAHSSTLSTSQLTAISDQIGHATTASYLRYDGVYYDVYTHPIRGSEDVHGSGPVYGRLMAIRPLDSSFETLQSVLGGNLRIEPPGVPSRIGPDAFEASYTLLGADGVPLATLLNRKETPEFARGRERRLRNQWWVAAVGVATAAVLVFLQRRWLFAPLAKIVAGNPADLTAMQSDPTEFGNLSKILLQHDRYQEELKRMIAELRAESERSHRLSAAVERAHNALAITDELLQLQWANAAFCTRHALDPAKLAGLDARELYTGPSVPAGSGRSVLRGRSASGHVCWFEVDVRPYFDTSGKRLGYTLLEIDVTDAHLSQESAQVLLTISQIADTAATRSEFIERSVLAVRGMSGVAGVRIKDSGGSPYPLSYTLAPDAPSRELLDARLSAITRRIVELLQQHADRLRFSAIFQDSPDGLLLVDPHGRLRIANRAAESLLGEPALSPNAPVDGRVLGVLIGVDHVHRAGGLDLFHTETLVRRNDGTSVPVEARFTRAGWSARPDEEQGDVLVTLRDLRPQRAAAAALAEERDRATRFNAVREALDLMLGRLPVNILVFDAEGRVTYANEACRSLLSGELQGTPYVPEDLDGDLRAAAEASAKSGTASDQRLFVQGEPVWFEVSAQPITLQERPQLLVTLIAIGERKRSEEALREALTLSESALSAKDIFLANTSHELRTPMNAVVGFTHLLTSTPLDAQQRDWVGKIGASADHLLQMLDDLLDHSKLLAGKLELERTPFDLGGLVDEVTALFVDRSNTKDILFVPDIAPELRRTFVGDPRRLKQILINLCSNAVKFTERGGVSLRVSTTGSTDDQVSIAFDVTDSGIGIGEADIERIFEPFTQGDGSLRRRFGGTGLGLSISDTLTKRMGGRLTVVSKLGAGSTFRCLVTLEAHRSPVPSRASAPPVRGPLRGSVLVVDDNPLNREVLAAYLDSYALDVAFACDGREAVNLVASAPRMDGKPPFELVFMDIQMPVLDGLDAARAIRHLPDPERARQPMVAMTAHAMERDRVDSLAAGMDDHLGKPIVPAQLDAVLRHWCAPEAEGG